MMSQDVKSKFVGESERLVKGTCSLYPSQISQILMSLSSSGVPNFSQGRERQSRYHRRVHETLWCVLLDREMDSYHNPGDHGWWGEPICDSGGGDSRRGKSCGI